MSYLITTRTASTVCTYAGTGSPDAALAALPDREPMGITVLILEGE